MKERGGGIPKKIKDPWKMLLEARDGLAKCRELFILSTLMLMSNPATNEELVFWGNIWFNASLEEKRITRELVVPAKLKTRAFRTVPVVEDEVRNNACDFVEKIGNLFEPSLPKEIGVAIVDPHIEFTKKIQKEMGVPENAVHVKKIIGGKYTVFTRKPKLNKTAC